MQLKSRFLIGVLLLHFFIIVAGGHGVIFLGLSVIFIPDLFDYIKSSVPIIDPVPGLGISGVLSLSGYAFLVTSVFCTNKQRLSFYLVGIFFLVVNLIWLMALDHYSDLISPKVLYLPFLLTSLYPFYRKYVNDLGRWLLK